jgi:hypothetical protein
MHITMTTPRVGLNFPTATPADWGKARRRLLGFLRRYDIDRERAEEITQAATVEMLTREYAGQCPATPAVAVGWAIARAKRYGIGTLTREGKRHSERRRRTGLEEPQPAADPANVRDTSSRPGPASIAAAIESAAGPETWSPVATRRRARIEAWVREACTGWGEADGSIEATTYGAGYTPPLRGCPGASTATDPRPEARDRAWAEVVAHAAEKGVQVTSRHRAGVA